MSSTINSERIRQLDLHTGLRVLHTALGTDADLHLVGGALRDIALGRESGDLDLATILAPEEVLARLEKAEIRVIPSGLQHQTVIAVPVKGSPGIEITSFRTAGMRPEGGQKLAGSIEEDLQYRDFTINALAYSLNSKTFVDPMNGLADVQAGIVRAVADPHERFTEDPLRVLRMIRFACMRGFRVDERTLEASKNFTDALLKTSIERIRDEFSALLCADTPSHGLTLYKELGILERLIPELYVCVGFEQNKYHEKAVFEHTLEVVDKSPAVLISRLAALFHDIGKPPTLTIDDAGERHFYCHESVGADITAEILQRLRYPKKTISAVCMLVATHMRPISAGKSGIRRILRDTGEHYDEWRALKEADSTSVRLDAEKLARELDDFDERVENVRSEAVNSPFEHLAINGNDILGLGVSPGPRIGEVLRSLHELVVDNPEVNEREHLLAVAKKELGV